jgi:dual specificity tyrosine-phosphorylation-regulated kinase 2/3/4
MEIMGAPPRRLVDAASRRKMFFDTAGAPRVQPNSRGE